MSRSIGAIAVPPIFSSCSRFQRSAWSASHPGRYFAVTGDVLRGRVNREVRRGERHEAEERLVGVFSACSFRHFTACSAIAVLE